MSKKTRRTREQILEGRAADDKRRKKLGLIPMSEEKRQASDRSLAKRLGLSLPEPDMKSTIFSKHGLLLPPFSRHGLTVIRRK